MIVLRHHYYVVMYKDCFRILQSFEIFLKKGVAKFTNCFISEKNYDRTIAISNYANFKFRFSHILILSIPVVFP